ncbi:MAG: 16S rRNA pseudouridine(516) synthase RsuA [Pseudomonadales bacterium]
MRLDKYLAHATGLSRKDVKKALHKSRVKIDDQAIRNGAHKVVEGDAVMFDDQLITAPQKRYIMLHKPQGYVCSNDDPVHPTVAGLLEDEVRADELNIAGRLDADTTGLLLLSDDGQWLHRITSPNHKLPKRYLVETADPIDPSTAERFAEGIELLSEKLPTKPAKLEQLSSHMAYLTLTEGRYHQVKRMFAATGNKVEELHRDRIGAIALDDTLALGEYRYLSQAEVDSLK